MLTRQSSETIGLLELQIDSAGKNIQPLDNEVSNIASVLSLIQGRGFAVVADEVRQLEQRTQSSTGQIHQMISTLQLAAQDSKQSVSQSIQTSVNTDEKSEKSLMN